MARSVQEASTRAVSHPGFGDAIRFALHPDAQMMRHLACKYGDVVALQAPGLYILILSHPEDIREVLVAQQGNFHKGLGVEMTGRLLGQGLITSEGEFHKRQRRFIQPAFHRQHIAGYASTMVDLANRQAMQWQDGAVVDMTAEMMRLTF